MRHSNWTSIAGILTIALMASTNIMAEEFQFAQVWEYQTRPIDSGSRLTIVEIDIVNEVRIIHISLDGVKIKNPQAPSGYGDKISHLPIEEESLKQSVTKLLGTDEALPDFEEGYKMWKEAFESGQGGYFTIPVSECVDYIEQALNQ